MKPYIKHFLLPALGILIFASCSSDDTLPAGPDTQDNTQIRFEINFAADDGMQSRTATGKDFTTKWETGDEIGIFAVKSGEPLAASGNSIHNMKVTFNGTSWNGAYWPNDNNKNENLDFYAYYPYDPSMTDPSTYVFSVKADQRAQADYNTSDLLLAKAMSQSRGNTVSLQFSHALALVQVEVKREVNVPVFDDTDFTVTLTDVLPGGILDWAASLTAREAAIDVTMHKVNGMDYTYRALIPAQALAADSKITFIQTIAGSEINMVYDGLKSAALTVGASHKYSVTLGWGINPDHHYAVGDYYPHVGPIIGMVFSITDGGKHGQVISIDQSSSLRWDDGNYDTEAESAVDGLANMAAIARYIYQNDKSWSNFPAFEWCDLKNGTAGSTTYSSGQTGIWYLPSIVEWEYIVCAITRNPVETWGDWPGSDDPGRAMPSFNIWGWDFLIPGWDAFDDKLSAAGGIRMGDGSHYLTSTQVNGTRVWRLKFSAGLLNSNTKGYSATVRAMLAF